MTKRSLLITVAIGAAVLAAVVVLHHTPGAHRLVPTLHEPR